MKDKGYFFVFEGIGGSGKGTQVKLLTSLLQEKKYEVLTSFEHTRDTPVGQLIDDTIYHRIPRMDLTALQLTFVADQANHTANVIVPGLEVSDYLLEDRYEASTVSYALPELREYFLMVNRQVTIRPDLTFIFDITPEEALHRIGRRNDADMFDLAEKMNVCRQGYRWYLDNSGWPCVWIDVDNKSREDVLDDVVWEISKRRLWK